jgi:primosomal protein N' (replication factor Y)
MPEQPAISFAVRHDYEGFVREESKHRKACNLPPAWRMAMMVLRDENFDKLIAACIAMKDKIDSIIAVNGLDVVVRGPMPCTINRIEQYHRMQIIFEAATSVVIQRLFGSLRVSGPIRPAVKISIDIDPVNLL